MPVLSKVNVRLTIVLMILLVLIAGHSHQSTWAQFDPLPPAAFPTPGDLGPARRLPRNPLTQAAYLRSVESISSGNITEGLETLQELIEQETDFLLTDSSSGPQSLFAQVEKLFQSHQADYERLFGGTARQLFNDAQSNQNQFQLEDVVRRFGPTSSGLAALAELSQLARDRGDPAQAARLLEEQAGHPLTTAPVPLLTEAIQLLMTAGEQPQATALLARHSALFPDLKDPRQLLPEGRAVVTSNSTDSPLFDWRYPYGSPSSSGSAQSAPALTEPAWQGDLVDDTFDFWLLDSPEVAQRLGSDTRKLMEAVEQRVRSESGRIAMPAGRPLVLQNLVITSGPGSVKAFRPDTGELVWNGLVIDETFEYLAKWSYSAGESQDSTREEMRTLFAAVRGWRDLTSSSISTDGQRVYVVTGCQLVGTTSPQRMMQNTQRHPLLPQRFNRLIAYDLSTEGKIIWPVNLHLSSPADEPLGEPREIFFFGAPISVDNHLYALGEERGQVQLFELDPDTGTILWSLGLLNPDRDLALDDTRRLAGFMPAAADGLLICPTGEGTLVAVDPLKRQVVWSHFYSTAISSSQAQSLMMRAIRPQNQAASQAREELLSDQRWFDSRVLISGPYVVFTPPDDDSLVCLNLDDGTPLFPTKIPRGQSLYAPLIYQDNLVLVGRSELRTVNLTGGPSLWKQPIPIPNPSGRGIRMGDQFLQPLQSGEIAVIDLPSGRLLTRLPIDLAMPPGNLASADGQLFLQSATGLTALRSRETLEQEIAAALSTNEDDPQGLAKLGTWELQRGQLAAGLKHLQRAARSENGTSPQSILVWSLLDGLRTDFAAYREQAMGLESSLQGNEQRLQFLRTFAQGLQNSGDHVEAFHYYLKILNLHSVPERVQDLDSHWGATVSRWALARLAEVYDAATPTEQETLRRLLADWGAGVTPEILLQLLPGMPENWIPPEIVLQRLQNVPLTAERLHFFETILLPLLKNNDPQVQVSSAALLLPVARATNDPALLKRSLERLEKHPELPTNSAGNRRARDLATATRQDRDVIEKLQGELQWSAPIHTEEQAGPGTRAQLVQIPRLGPLSSIIGEWTFFLDQAGGNVEIFDSQGRWRERISTGAPGTRFAVESDLARYVCFHHHLAVIVLLDRFLVIDLLTESGTPRLITNRSLILDGDSPFSGSGPFSLLPRAGLRSSLMEFRTGRLSGNAGPVTDSQICFTTGNQLIAIHPVTGKELWRRRDIISGSEVLGDNEYIIVKPPEEAALDIFRALDGTLLARRPLPLGVLTNLERLNGDWGRYLPCVNQNSETLEFQIYDPVKETVVWKHTAPAGTLWTVVEGQDLAFLTPKQELTILDGLTGAPSFAVAFPAKDKVQQFSVIRYPEQIIVVTALQRPDLVGRQTLGVRSQDLILSDVNGQVIAFSPTGGDPIWAKEVAGQRIAKQVPRDWPILLLPRGRGRLESLILNRFTGEEIRRHASADDGTGSAISWLTETSPLRLNLKFGTDRTTLYFGTTPPTRRPNQAPKQSESIPNH